MSDERWVAPVYTTGNGTEAEGWERLRRSRIDPSIRPEVLAAEARGWAAAVAALRDRERWAKWRGEEVGRGLLDRWVGDSYADYLESIAPTGGRDG